MGYLLSGITLGYVHQSDALLKDKTAKPPTASCLLRNCYKMQKALVMAKLWGIWMHFRWAKIDELVSDKEIAGWLLPVFCRPVRCQIVLRTRI